MRMLILIASVIRSVVVEEHVADNELKGDAMGRRVRTHLCQRTAEGGREGGERGNPIGGVAAQK